MSNSATEIANLLYLYAESMDAGDLEAAAELFRHAEIIVDPRPGADRVGADGILEIWRSTVQIHEDGTPRTKHVTTNPIIEIDEEAGTATCRSYYTVFQQTDTLPLQPIVAGRYHDRFERVDGRWRFSERNYSLMDHAGNLTQHLSVDLLSQLDT